MSESENNSKESLLEGAKNLINTTQKILDTAKEALDHPESLLGKAKDLIKSSEKQEQEKKADSTESKE
ncbi:MAG: hypothetical protein ACRYE8_00920 [Janthinobacterium lividum]